MLLLSSHSKFFHLLKSKDDDGGKLQAPALNIRFLHLKRLAQNRSCALARPTDLSCSWEVKAYHNQMKTSDEEKMFKIEGKCHGWTKIEWYHISLETMQARR